MLNHHLNASFSKKFTLKCTHCGETYAPNPFRLYCANDHPLSLLRVRYHHPLHVRETLPGIFRYIDWLPVEHPIASSGRPTTYQSQGLAQHLNLANLWISFNGYWPEKNGSLETCSFKELEASAVLAQLQKSNSGTLVVSSAGNTGRAFAVIGSRHSQPICIVTPTDSLPAYWSRSRFQSNISLITVDGNADYTDAIRLGKAISQIPGYFPEGGVHNVARRAGMGLTVIDAAVTLGEIPQHYFQAVGSGTGGIAAWEAALTLAEDGRFGTNLMKLHLSQNYPFAPLVEAWQQGIRSIPLMPEDDAKHHISQVSAPVLTNRKPAYALYGGVYDALTATEGNTYSVTNADAQKAQHLFQETEGIDISPAAGVATASLIQAIESGAVGGKDSILLNITSGGVKRFQQDHPIDYLNPSLSFPPKFLDLSLLERELKLQLDQSVPA